METMNNRKIGVGILLIVLGILIYFVQRYGVITETVPLLLAGTVFVIMYFLQKKVGFLIPGCILLGIAFGEIMDNTVTWLGDMDAIGLGLGFVAIYVITFIFEEKSHWWPLIPGGFLVFSGISQGNIIIAHGWPIILILVGVLLLIREFKSKKSEEVTDFTKTEE